MASRVGAVRQDFSPPAYGRHRIRGQPLCHPQRLRLHRNTESHERERKAQAETRSKHHQPADGKERVPVAAILMAPQGIRSLLHMDDRTLLV